MIYDAGFIFGYAIWMNVEYYTMMASRDSVSWCFSQLYTIRMNALDGEFMMRYESHARAHRSHICAVYLQAACDPACCGLHETFDLIGTHRHMANAYSYSYVCGS